METEKTTLTTPERTRREINRRRLIREQKMRERLTQSRCHLIDEAHPTPEDEEWLRREFTI